MSRSGVKDQGTGGKKKIKDEAQTKTPSGGAPEAGSTESCGGGGGHWERKVRVSVPTERAAQPVRAFGTFTPDLYALAEWLGQCQVTSVALESTGRYWIPLYEVLEARGLEV